MDFIINWFESTSHASFVNVLLGVLTIIVAIVALVLRGRAHARSAKMARAQDEVRRKKERRAILVARSEKEPHEIGCSFYLAIENKGCVEARNVQVRCDGKDMFEHPAIVRGDFRQPLKQIGGHAKVRFVVVYEGPVQPPPDVSIEWDDDSGDKGSFFTQLSWL